MPKIAILLDGGHLRVQARLAGKAYDPDFIAAFAAKCAAPDETVFRVFYYDCAPFSGKRQMPVTGEYREFKKSDDWLKALAKKDLFAVRLGVLKFRGFKPKKSPLDPSRPSDEDFDPILEQKGVDLRIGLDIATLCQNRAVERVALLTNDTDLAPAMKHARIAGLQVVLLQSPAAHASYELVRHADFLRRIDAWP